MSLDKLKIEITKCIDEAIPLSMWWRDDDLINLTTEFDSLTKIAKSLEIPLLCSIIPKQASKNLNLISENSFIYFCQHGYGHINHESNLNLKNEFGTARTAEEVGADILQGQELLRELNQLQFESVFVPPWNRFEFTYLPILDELGFTHISCYGFNSLIKSHHKIQFLNTHLDITFWGENLTFLRQTDEIYNYLADIFREYRSRYSQTQKQEVIGLLSHHRVMKNNDFDTFHKILTTLKDVLGIKFITPY